MILDLGKKRLVQDLISSWHWQGHEHYYLNVLVPELIKNPQSTDPREQRILTALYESLTDDEWRSLDIIIQNALKELKIEEKMLEAKRTEDAAEKKRLDEAARIALLEERERVQQARLREQELADLAESRERAENEQKRMHVNSVLQLLEQHLKAYDFDAADKAYSANLSLLSDVFDIELYETAKSRFIQAYFRDFFVSTGVTRFPPDAEQASAIGALGKDVLVSARAGSGKTQTVSAKVALLCSKYNVHPDEVLVLTFNKMAAESMKSKIRTFVPGFENAVTFHSWANSIVRPAPESLIFDNKGEFSQKAYSNFVKEVIELVVLEDPDVKNGIYKFFRDENTALDEGVSETKQFKSEDERYFYLRNLTETTLSGVHVKSRGEKWIADFLFEHDIEFYYEQQLTWKKIENVLYRPDFTLNIGGKKYIIEHWGIDEADPNHSVPLHWNKTWQQYHSEMCDKRNFFEENQQFKFIETSIRDIDYSLPIETQRQKFELLLKERLENLNIKCIKLPIEVLAEKAWSKQLFTQLNSLSCQFISWMQKLEWTQDDLLLELRNNEYSSRQKHFAAICLKIYNKYTNELKKAGKIDFNTLVSQATNNIVSDNYKVGHYKYILIDEFQDFSLLFLNLINAVRSKNSDMSLFCVGDPWQLINGFAGSDAKLFKNYANIARLKSIATCYRSNQAIVDNANRFATTFSNLFEGSLSKCAHKSKGQVKKYLVNSIFIDNGNSDTKVDDEYRMPFVSRAKDNSEYLHPENIIKARYLKKCVELIVENPSKNFLFLSRKSKFAGMDWSKDFMGYILATLKCKNIEIDTHSIKFATIHSSKGLEADIAVILDTNTYVIPTIHPSNELFEIFGRTQGDILDEEKRLYYVAITRAKEKLFILTEEGKESEFIKVLAQSW